MSMELEAFSGGSLVEDGDRIKAKELVDRPLLVYVVDEVGPIKTQHSKTPEGDMGLILDIKDLSDNSIYLSVLWMNKQVVDNLTRYIGKAVAITLNWKKSKSGNDYLNLTQLEGDWAAYAANTVKSDPNVFVNERARREMKSYDEIRGSKVTGMNMNAGNPPATPPAQAPAPAATVPPAAPPAAPAPAAAPATTAPPAAPTAPPAAPTTPPAPVGGDDDDMPF